MTGRVNAVVAVTVALGLVAGGPAFSQSAKPLADMPANSAPPQPAPDTVASMPKPPPEPALPALPPAPQYDAAGYPGCREDWQKLADPYKRASATNACTKKLDTYYADVMTPYVKAMSAHQDEVSRLYTDRVARNPAYSEKSKQSFYSLMMDEHARSDPDGANMATYRATLLRYRADRDYLQDRFCFNTGCGGYPKPNLAAARPEAKDSAKPSGKSADDKKVAAKKGDGCGGSRKAGGVLGGFIGGIAGNQAGLGRVGTVIASGLSGVLVGEIACKLTKEEQQKAAEATVAVTEKEEVGATEKWISPTRSGVSGSSTVTALNTEPNGRKCLSITDVAIVDGEETRVAKQMCRKPGESRYSLVA